MSRYVPLRVAKKQLSMSGNTLRKYADEGQIDAIKNEAGQRLYNVDSYIGKRGAATTVCYARVSSRHQANDLTRQRQHLLSLYPGAEVVTDIGSGLNFKRKGLRAILERLMRGDKLTLVVAHRDRLARFGFDLIKWMVEYNGGTVVVQGGTTYSPQQELVSDLLAIITVFGARVNGLRRYGKQIKEDSDLSEQGAAKSD